MIVSNNAFNRTIIELKHSMIGSYHGMMGLLIGLS